MQFQDNMTWDNYGTGFNGRGMKEWHIDHIRPCASFYLNQKKNETTKSAFITVIYSPYGLKENLEKRLEACKLKNLVIVKQRFQTLL